MALTWVEDANIRGPQGPQGATGAQGPAGTGGAQGLTGAPGADGAPGATGSQGTQGIQGATGSQGPAGTAGDAITVYDAGTAPGTWTPDAANGSRQKAVLGGAVTMNPPSNPPRDGFRVSVSLTATGASRVLTLGSAFLFLVGWPTSIQLSTTAVGFARMEWNAAKSKWVVLSLTATA